MPQIKTPSAESVDARCRDSTDTPLVHVHIIGKASTLMNPRVLSHSKYLAILLILIRISLDFYILYIMFSAMFVSFVVHVSC